jgi:predicted RND superfamily exporter protein
MAAPWCIMLPFQRLTGSFSSTAFPTFLIDYLYQVTFLVALIVLDERRIKANRLDIVICCKSGKNSNMDKYYDATLEGFASGREESDDGLMTEQSVHVADRIMAWYARQLLRPVSRFLVLFLFSLFFGFCISRVALMKQEFDVTTLFPADSYVKDAINTLHRFQERTITFSIVFRHENQADPEVQKQMISFVEDIQAMPAFGAPPPVCWVRDFQLLQKTDYYDVIKDMTFAEQLEFALAIPAFKEAYGNDIVLDYETGNITASRCVILARNSFVDTVASQIDLLMDQRAVTEAQPINQGKAPGDESFFTYRDVYLLWSFFSVAVNELVSTTVLSVSAVALVTLVFIPHWTAVSFILPLMIVVYIDLMGKLMSKSRSTSCDSSSNYSFTRLCSFGSNAGVMQMAGLHINGKFFLRRFSTNPCSFLTILQNNNNNNTTTAITMVCLVISIGLFVDFQLHILNR